MPSPDLDRIRAEILELVTDLPTANPDGGWDAYPWSVSAIGEHAFAILGATIGPSVDHPAYRAAVDALTHKPVRNRDEWTALALERVAVLYRLLAELDPRD